MRTRQWREKSQVPHPRRVQQCDVLSTTLFILYVDSLIRRIQKLGKAVSIHVDGRQVDDFAITDLVYADDVCVITANAARMHKVLCTISQWCAMCRMQVNPMKTEILVCRPRYGRHQREIDDDGREHSDCAAADFGFFNNGRPLNEVSWRHFPKRSTLDKPVQVNFGSCEKILACGSRGMLQPFF